MNFPRNTLLHGIAMGIMQKSTVIDHIISRNVCIKVSYSSTVACTDIYIPKLTGFLR
jgi:hypothetical protein